MSKKKTPERHIKFEVCIDFGTIAVLLFLAPFAFITSFRGGGCGDVISITLKRFLFWYD